MKPITANDLLQFFEQLQADGHDLSKIAINFRTDNDSDVQPCVAVEEDLFDAETNSRLESIVFLANNNE